MCPRATPKTNWKLPNWVCIDIPSERLEEVLDALEKGGGRTLTDAERAFGEQWVRSAVNIYESQADQLGGDGDGTEAPTLGECAAALEKISKQSEALAKTIDELDELSWMAIMRQGGEFYETYGTLLKGDPAALEKSARVQDPKRPLSISVISPLRQLSVSASSAAKRLSNVSAYGTD